LANDLFLGFLIGYLLIYAWFSPITHWSTFRFTYTLFLPFLFWASVAVHKLVAESPDVEFWGRNIRQGHYLKMFDIAILGLIIVDIIHFIPDIIMSSQFGG
jgi:hypothetical protein